MINSKQKNIAVIFGGQSAEHDVSIITAHEPIIKTLIASEQYKVYPIYIAKNGSWYSDESMNELAYFKDTDFEKKILKTKKIRLLFEDGFKIIWSGFKKKTVTIDIVFPAMHGTFGEDGSLMGLLRMAGVPFVGCDIFASTIAMDKVLTKQILQAENLPVVPYVWFTKFEWANHKEKHLAKISNLKMPLFVKPVHLGSSIAITKVKNEIDLKNAIEVAFHYDDKILVEESIENLLEITLPIIGNDDLTLGGIEKPLNKTEFFDFDNKYLKGNKKSGGVNSEYSEIPAKIETKLADEIKSLGIRTYKILGCSGIARIDFLIDNNTQRIYVNEVNTLPGSLYQHNFKKTGISNFDLIDRLIKMAEERFDNQKNITYTFKSEILNKASGNKL